MIRATTSISRGKAFPKVVVETPVNSRGRDRAKGRGRGVALYIGCTDREAPTKGRGKDVSPELRVKVVEHQVPLDFRAFLFQGTSLKGTWVSENLSLRVHTLSLQQTLSVHVEMGSHLWFLHGLVHRLLLMLSRQWSNRNIIRSFIR